LNQQQQQQQQQQASVIVGIVVYNGVYTSNAKSID